VLLDAQRGQQFCHPGPGLPPGQPGQLGGQQHIVGHGQVVQQVEELEDHADPLPPEPGQPGLAEPVDPLSGHGDRPAGRPVQPGDEVEQGGLAAPGRSHHRDRLAWSDVQADRPQRGRPVVLVLFRDAAELYHRVRGRAGGAPCARPARPDVRIHGYSSR
jgi:hypothetical protein